MAIRVVIAEDNALLRSGVERLLATAEGIEVVASAGDLQTLYDAVAATEPDVVLTDIRMPPSFTDEGIEVARTLRNSHPTLGVCVLSQHLEPTFAVELLAGGTGRRAYLLKERVADIEELTDAIKRVAEGGSVVDPQVVEALVSARQVAPASVLDRLSPREREVLGQMAQGKSNSAIAEQLFVSERAVEKHSTSIFAKLDLSEEPDLNRRVTAVLLWLRDGQETR